MSFRSFRCCWQVVFVDVSLLQCGKLFMRSGLRRGEESELSFVPLLGVSHRTEDRTWLKGGDRCLLSVRAQRSGDCVVAELLHRVLQSFFVGRFNYGEYSGVFPLKRSSDRRQVLNIWDKTSSRSNSLSSASSFRRWRLVWTLFIPVPDSPVV
ncbi:hypothetical protein Bca4012_099277 [Brassica carinata]